MLLAPAGAAGARHAVLAGERGASGWVILQPRIQVALLVILLVHKLVVLPNKDKETKTEGVSHKEDLTFTTLRFMAVYRYGFS